MKQLSVMGTQRSAERGGRHGHRVEKQMVWQWCRVDSGQREGGKLN